MSNELILYRTDDGLVQMQLQAIEGSIWLSQLEIATLFDTTKQNASLHIKNVLSEGELPQNSVVKDSLTTAADGKKYRTKLYRLEMILEESATCKKFLQVRQEGNPDCSEGVNERNGASHRFVAADVVFVIPAASAVPLTNDIARMFQGVTA